MVNRGIIALDADGVLLDFSLAYAHAWQRVFGQFPAERDPLAYWPRDRWQVDKLDGERLERLRSHFDEDFWASLPAMPGALAACQRLAQAGYELVCVTALPDRFAKARRDNLLQLSFPIEVVHTVGYSSEGPSPKAQLLHALQPLAFVDDYLPYFVGVQEPIHRALVQRAPNGSPNSGESLRFVDSQHDDLLAFADWWMTRPAG
jgi:phosphoglycolate phosphatase-like HAD superfamily hydrolase